MKIYLIRHIKTENNDSGVFMGRSIDSPIIDTEIEKFKNIISKQDFSSVNKSIFYSSPSLRCKQTIEIFMDELGIEKKYDIKETFAEANYGGFEGKTLKEIKKEYPKQFDNLVKTPSQVVFPEGESLVDVQKRAVKEVEELVTNNKAAANIFICTHVDVIKTIIFNILGASIDKKKYIHIDNSSISCIESTPIGYKVVFTNRS